MGFKVKYIWECDLGKSPIPTKPIDPASEEDIKMG